MNRKFLISIAIIGVLIVGGITAYILRPTAEATAPIEAPSVEAEPSEPADDVMDDKSADDSMSEEAADESSGELPDDSNKTVFEIDQSTSEVRFTLDELLRGSPKTVIGATNQVAGEIVVDFENPSNSMVGVILINARTFATDNDFRNRAINNEILETDEFEYITFTPKAINGFPENPQIGEEFGFQIVGDLTIRDITHEVVFDMKVTVVSESKIKGFGSTMVAREPYDLKIPNVPSVADVDEEVLLEIEFTANAK